MYSPNLGRWMTVDPMGFSGSGDNSYLGLQNNPINLLDPFGLAPTQSMPNVEYQSSMTPLFQWNSLIIPNQPQNLQYVTHIEMEWQIHRCSTCEEGFSGRSLITAGRYSVWVAGTDIIKQLRSDHSGLSMLLSPKHASHNGVNNGPDRIPLPYPSFKDDAARQDSIGQSRDARGTRGTLKISITIKGFNHAIGLMNDPLNEELLGPVEHPGEIIHPRSPQIGGIRQPVPVTPNRLRGANFRQLGRWSLSEPEGWNGAAAWEYSTGVLFEWDYCSDKFIYASSISGK